MPVRYQLHLEDISLDQLYVSSGISSFSVLSTCHPSEILHYIRFVTREQRGCFEMFCIHVVLLLSNPTHPVPGRSIHFLHFICHAMAGQGQVHHGLDNTAHDLARHYMDRAHERREWGDWDHTQPHVDLERTDHP
jgi:hypothetical protein